MIGIIRAASPEIDELDQELDRLIPRLPRIIGWSIVALMSAGAWTLIFLVF